MLPVQRAYLNISILDERGKTVRRFRQRRARSYTQAYIRMLRGMMAHAMESSPRALVPTGNGTDRIWYTFSVDSSGPVRFALMQPTQTVSEITADEYGIVVGTGNTPVSISDFKLESQITHGSGPGQLIHNPLDISNLEVDTDAETCDLRVSRSFTNASGAEITVRECGIYVINYNTQASPDISAAHLIMRDVLNPAAAVPNGHSLLIEYILRIGV